MEIMQSSVATADPKCQSQAFGQAYVAVIQNCGDFSAFGAIFDASGNANQTAINQMCADKCTSALSNARNNFGSCLGSASDLLGLDAVISMCQKVDGQYCIVKMQTFGKLSGCENFQSNATCVGATGKSCSWALQDDGTSKCQPNPTQADLQQMCSSCFDKFVVLIGRLAGTSSGSSSTKTLIQTLMLAKQLLCVKSGNTFCYPVLIPVNGSILNADPKNQMPIDQILGNISTLCTGDNKGCLPAYGTAIANIARLGADSSYRSCPYTTSTCVSQWEQVYRGAAKIEKQLGGFCSTNDAGTRCIDEFQKYVKGSCMQSIFLASQPTCNATCASDFQSFITRVGCCAWRSKDQSNVTVPADGIPAVSGVTNPQQYLSTSSKIDDGIGQIAALCNASGSSNFSLATINTTLNTPCKGPSSMPTKSLKISGLVWDKIKSNSALRAELAQAATKDVAARLGVSTFNIINGTLVEDTTQKLAASTSRRQTTGASGTKFQFQLGGQNDADVSAASSAFDSAAASNSVQLQSTATVLQNECTTCVASPVAPPGSTPAPVNQNNLFASLGGGDTTGTGTGGSGSSPSSSAASVGVVAAVVAAAAIVACF
jgi:hypothetical protein